MDSLSLWIGLVVVSTLAAAGLAAPGNPRHRLACLALALVIAPVLIAADNWNTERFVDLRDSPALIVAVGIAAILGLVLLVALVRWRPNWLPLALIAVLPFRIPIELAGSTANLLVPLYGLLAAGLIAALLQPERIVPALDDQRSPADLRRWIAPVLAAGLVLYGLQSGYAGDISAAVENLCFFFVPFAALFTLVMGARWDRAQARTLVIVLGAVALVVALIAFGQYATGKLFWNEKVIDGNEAHAYFRVNSIFYDPNIMGRYLALTMIVIAAVVAWGRRREAEISAGVFALLLIALIVTFSQSSMLALLGGMLILAAARFGLAWGVAAAAATLVAMAVTVFAVSGGGLTEETTGRTGLVSGGLELAGERPIVGWGAGSFPTEFQGRFGGGDGYAVESHTEPITVAMEQGAIGLVPYLALLAVAVGGMWTSTGIGLREARDPVAATLFAAFAAMLVHSMGYAAFFTDPLTWVLLALALVLPEAVAARGSPGSATQPARAA
jgi:putative inorganic carbon (hco3(-)) transporter